MGKQIACCISNLSRFQYGALLQQFVDEGHDVQLERCQNHCVSCRNEPALIVDGKWGSAAQAEDLRKLIQA